MRFQLPKTAYLVFALLFLPSVSVFAQEKTADPKTAQQQESKTPGIAIGEALPEITLLNQSSEEVSVQELLKNGPVAIVFYRSAQW